MPQQTFRKNLRSIADRGVISSIVDNGCVPEICGKGAKGCKSALTKEPSKGAVMPALIGLTKKHITEGVTVLVDGDAEVGINAGNITIVSNVFVNDFNGVPPPPIDVNLRPNVGAM